MSATVARSKQVYIEWMEATVLLSIYLRSELILIDTKVLSARCPLADVLGSACEAPTTSPGNCPAEPLNYEPASSNRNAAYSQQQRGPRWQGRSNVHI
jgi:hypothetical protein